jgi:hypothetical protein
MAGALLDPLGAFQSKTLCLKNHRKLSDGGKSCRQLTARAPAGTAMPAPIGRGHWAWSTTTRDGSSRATERALAVQVKLTTLMGLHATLAFNVTAVDLGLAPELTEPPLPV